MTTVLAFDPGETTGWACAYSETGKLETGELRYWRGADRLIRTVRPDMVAIESFRLYPGRALGQSWSDFPPVQVIGVLRFICEDLAHVRYVLQSASEMKGFVLRMPGLKISVHEYDASRHAMLYLRRTSDDERFRDYFRAKPQVRGALARVDGLTAKDDAPSPWSRKEDREDPSAAGAPATGDVGASGSGDPNVRGGLVVVPK